MANSQRLTVRSHNIEFLKTLATQMGIGDLSEVLNYLLLDCKGLNYRFGDKPTPQQQQPQQIQPIGYAFDPTTFEPAFTPVHEQNSIDPMIQRLIDSGLEMEF